MRLLIYPLEKFHFHLLSKHSLDELLVLKVTEVIILQLLLYHILLFLICLLLICK